MSTGREGGGGFPSTVTTSTTTKVTPLIWFDSSYLYTRAGSLKAAAVILDLIAFISASVGYCSSCASVTFFNLIAMLGFWSSLVLLSLYLFHVIEKLYNINWLLAEFVFTGVWCVFYLVASLTILTNGGVYAAASFFGFIAAAVYGYDSFLKYHAYQDGEIAQGERTVQVAGGSSQA